MGNAGAHGPGFMMSELLGSGVDALGHKARAFEPAVRLGGREQNQVELYGRIERFLRTHMPAGPESGTRAPASP